MSKWLLLLSLVTPAAFGADASSLKIKVYSVRFSTSTLCTNAVTVFDKTTPDEVDFLSVPTIGGGDLADGTYNCIIIKMSDNIKFKTAAATGTCAANTEYTLDLCRTDGNGSSIAPDGTTIPCTGTWDGTKGDDTIYLYITTNTNAPTNPSGDTFKIPNDTDSTRGIKLGAALTIAGTTKSKFVVNATGKVTGDLSSCDMNAPLFSFEKVP